jgi:hypothetical protein
MAKTRTPGITVLADAQRFIDKTIERSRVRFIENKSYETVAEFSRG